MAHILDIIDIDYLRKKYKIVNWASPMNVFVCAVKNIKTQRFSFLWVFPETGEDTKSDIICWSTSFNYKTKVVNYIDCYSTLITGFRDLPFKHSTFLYYSKKYYNTTVMQFNTKNLYVFDDKSASDYKMFFRKALRD